MQIFIKTSFILFAFLLSTVSIFGRSLESDSLRALVKEIEQSNTYEMSAKIGYAGAESKQYLRFERLVRLATHSELIELAGAHKNAVVRLYALQALKRRDLSIPAELLQQFERDHTTVMTVNDCVVDNQPVSALAQTNLVLAKTEKTSE